MSRIVTLGEIMGRFAAPGFKRLAQAMPGSLDITFAGAEATVAAAISYWGGEAAFASPHCRRTPSRMPASRICARWTWIRDTFLRTPYGRLGLYFLETGANQRPSNVIYDREGAAVAIAKPEEYDWNAIFADASWFHITGITPALSANAAEVTRAALREAVSRKLPISMDMNFRSKLWNWAPPLTPRELAARTIQELLPYVTVFMGGREDAAAMLDIHPHESAEDLDLDVARQISARFPQMTHVAMSLRENISATHNLWSGMLYEVAQDKAFYAPIKDGPKESYSITDIVDRLGAGDAFAAGLIFALTTPDLSAPDKAVSFAVAAGCLAHSIEGDFNYCSRAEIETLMSGDTAGRVRR